MTKNEIIERITALAANHAASDDDTDAEYLEQEALELITTYCELAGYQINGFPIDKKKEAENNPELDDDYFSTDRYQCYVDMLTLEYEDVADLSYHCASSFWPEQFEDRAEFIDCIKGQIASGESFYGLEL